MTHGNCSQKLWCYKGFLWRVLHLLVRNPGVYNPLQMVYHHSAEFATRMQLLMLLCSHVVGPQVRMAGNLSSPVLSDTAHSTTDESSCSNPNSLCLFGFSGFKWTGLSSSTGWQTFGSWLSLFFRCCHSSISVRAGLLMFAVKGANTVTNHGPRSLKTSP